MFLNLPQEESLQLLLTCARVCVCVSGMLL